MGPQGGAWCLTNLIERFSPLADDVVVRLGRTAVWPSWTVALLCLVTSSDLKGENKMITYRVKCEDGQYRHPSSFGTREEAARFANWGHCCTVNHEIEVIDEPTCGNCLRDHGAEDPCC